MPPVSAALDPFTAIAEPRRREILAALAKAIDGRRAEVPVNDLVEILQWPQPQVSKHLAVLRDVGIVAVRRRGRERLYSINGPALKTIHDWISMYDKFWTHQLSRIKQRAEARARMANAAAAPFPLHPHYPANSQEHRP